MFWCSRGSGRRLESVSTVPNLKIISKLGKRCQWDLLRLSFVVVIVGSKGKEQFHRPLCKSSNTPGIHRIDLVRHFSFSIWCWSSSRGQVELVQHVFDEGLTFISLFVILLQHKFIFWLRQSTLLLCIQCDPLALPPNQLHYFFLCPPSTALFSILLYQLRFNLGRGRLGSSQAP